MRVFFRVDSSIVIGSGHVMRCLTLAKVLKERGAEITFITRNHNGNLTEIIQAEGYHVILLSEPEGNYQPTKGDTVYADWLGVFWEQDAKETKLAIGNLNPEWLVVDHYALDKSWESSLRNHVKRIMVIDDLADRPHVCDLLLDQNYYEDMEHRYDSLVASSCTKFYGPDYVLLRSEFREHRNEAKRFCNNKKLLFLFFGGTDPTNVTGKVLNAIQKLGRNDISVTVVVGETNPQKEQIKELCISNPNYQFYSQVGNMAELMAKADVAIGAGGGAMWERACLGLPSIVITIADNQDTTSRNFAEEGYIIHLGNEGTVIETVLCHAINLLLDNESLWNHLSKSSRELIDGNGAYRIANKLMPNDIRLRRVTAVDSDDVLSWRNAPETRQYFINPLPIPLETHNKWYMEKLSDPSCAFLIGETEGGPVGVLRYDFVKDTALVSVYIVPGKHGMGYGSSLIKAGNNWLKDNEPEIEFIQADILPANKASIRAFINAGFEQNKATYRYDLRCEFYPITIG